MQLKIIHIIPAIFLIYLGVMGIYGIHAALKKENWTSGSEGILEQKHQFERLFLASFSDNEMYLSPLAKAKLSLLHKSISPKVIPGKEGWLFLGEEEKGRNTLMQSTGLKYLDAKTLYKWKLLLSQRHEWCNKNGIKYYLIMPPNKASIYPEYLPDRVHTLPGPGFLEKLSIEFKSAGIPVINLTTSILEGKNEMQVYYKNDTHWSDYGAYLGSEVILDTLKKFTGIKFPYPEYRFENSEGAMSDLARMSLKSYETESVPTLKLTGPAQYVEDKAKAKIFPEYLGCEVTLNEKGVLPKAQFFHDSFGEMLKPFLSPHFVEIQFFRIWQGFEPYWIQVEMPEIVLNQIVERAFLGELPLNNAWLIENYWSKRWKSLKEIKLAENYILTSSLPEQSVKSLTNENAIFVIRLTLSANTDSWMSYKLGSQLQKFDLKSGETRIFIEVDPENPGLLDWDRGYIPLLKDIEVRQLDIPSIPL